MPVKSSIKDCWSKFSAKIRDYLEANDSSYRSEGHDSLIHAARHRRHQTNRTSQQKCETRSPLVGIQEKRRSSSGHKLNHCHNTINSSTQAPLISPQGQPMQRSRPHLPAGFVKRKTSQGQVFFLDSDGQKHWYDPSVPKWLIHAPLNLDILVGKLSHVWEVKQTPSGKTYFINHSKKTTQFTDPRLVAYKDHLLSIFEFESCNEIENILSPEFRSLGWMRYKASPNMIPFRCPAEDETSENVAGPPPCSPTSNTNPSSNNQNTGPTRIKSNNSIFPQYNISHNQLRNNTSAQNHLNRSINTPNNVDENPKPRQHRANTDRRPAFGSQEHRRYLLNGLCSNLNQSSHSNTLNGPILTWFKEVAPTGPSIQPSERANISTPPTSRSSANHAAQSSTLTRPTSRPSATHSLNRSESANNLYDQNNASSLSLMLSQMSPFQNAKPSLNQSALSTGDNRELYDKISILRQELLKHQAVSHTCRIDINRKRIFEESFKAISQLHTRDLKKRLLIKFRGEEGLDYGGIAREWFYLLSREMLNPIHGLFQYTSDDIYNLQINPDSGIVYREHLSSYMHFCGRILGMAVFHGHFIDGHFTLPFYKMLLRKTVTLKDIEFVDPDLHRSLCWILENDITDVIDTTFLVQHNAFGQLQEHELKENGRNIAVTEENKLEYVTLYVNYRCRRGIEKQFESLQRGFDELISPTLLENFDERELELLVGGLSRINIEDWRSHTKLKNCTAETPLVKWFWDIVKSYGEDKRARLLQFVTGSPRVPIQGFKALQGVNSKSRLFTIHLIENSCTDNLPESHTCFNRIDLPPYETYDKLRDKLTQAIEETIGFAMQ